MDTWGKTYFIVTKEELKSPEKICSKKLGKGGEVTTVTAKSVGGTLMFGQREGFKRESGKNSVDIRGEGRGNAERGGTRA